MCVIKKLSYSRIWSASSTVDVANRFVSQKSKENLKSSGEDEEEEADGPDYEPRETSHTVITTNEVF